eukprot:scaffold5514_cov188-Alexandrium_tamarense.AAC.4
MRVRTESEDRKLRTRALIQRGKVIAVIVLSSGVLSLGRYQLSILSSMQSGSTVGATIGLVREDMDESLECTYHNPHRNKDGQSTSASSSSTTTQYKYSPASIEQYILENASKLGYDTSDNTQFADTCAILRDTSSPIYNDLQSYFAELEHYNTLVREFDPIPDLRLRLHESGDNLEEVCNSVKIHPEGLLKGVFQRQLLSSASGSGSVGYMEPLLPTMRSQKICNDLDTYLLSMEYLIHDFHAMCQKLKKHSKLVFVDMGASLDFHDSDAHESPAIYVNSIYSKFGFTFDHIYAYEITQKSPPHVFESVPNELQSAYHWINVGVDPRPCAKMNPFTMIANNFSPDDLIVVKLDIDTPEVESRLARQLRDDPWILELVDQFYFEDHVHQLELAERWTGTMNGSVKRSLELMSEIRRKGVAAHYWP